MSQDQDARLGEALVRLGHCTPQQIAEARRSLEVARKGGLEMDLSEVLLKKGFADDRKLQAAFQRVYAAEPRRAAPLPAAVPKTETVPRERDRSSRRPRRPEEAADRPATPPEARPTPRSGFKVGLAFGASFLLSFPILLGVLHLVRKKGGDVDVATPATPEPAPVDLFAPEPRRDPFPRDPVPAGGGGAKRDPLETDPEPDPGSHAARVDEILTRARDHALAKDYVEALTLLTYLLKTAGGDPRVREEVDRVEAARRLDVRAFLEEAGRRIDRGDVAGARRKLEVVLWWSPGDSEARSMMKRIEGR